MQFAGQEQLSMTVTDIFTTELFKLGKFDIYERHQIDKILNEQGLSYSGVTEEKTRKQLGKLTNLDALFIGMVSSYHGGFGTTDISLAVRLIDIESGSLIYSCSAKSDHALVALGTIGESMDVVINAIVKDINKHFR